MKKIEFTQNKSKHGTKLTVWVNGEIAETVSFTKLEEKEIETKKQELLEFYENKQ